jgi:hypothetical protein
MTVRTLAGVALALLLGTACGGASTRDEGGGAPAGGAGAAGRGALGEMPPDDPACTPGTFVAAGNFGTLATTTDGVAWETPIELAFETTLDGVAFGNGGWLALGIEGEILTSPDGVLWQTRTETTGLEAYDLVVSGSEFLATGTDIAVGTAAVVRSSDGLAWEPLTSAPSYLYFASIAEGPGARVAVALGSRQGTSTRPSALFQGSLEGELHEVRSFGADGEGQLEKVAFGAGRFVAVGNRLVAASEDGISWDVAAVEAEFAGVTFGAGRFVAVGRNAAGFSTDGLTWSVSSLSTPGIPGEIEFWMEDVLYADCRFFTVGGPDGWCGTSPDGVTWELSYGPTHGSFLEVAFAQQR